MKNGREVMDEVMNDFPHYGVALSSTSLSVLPTGNFIPPMESFANKLLFS